MSNKPSKKDIQFAALMSLVTTFFVTFILVTINVGFTNQFIMVWMRSWLIAFILVGLAILFLAPIIRNYIHK